MIYKNGYIEDLEKNENTKLSREELEERFQEFLAYNKIYKEFNND